MEADSNTIGVTGEDNADCNSDSGNLDTDTQNYLYSLVYHDTSKMPPDNKLPFFVDRTGKSGGGAAFEVVDISDQCDSHMAVLPIANAAAAVVDAANASEDKQQPRRKRRKLNPLTDVDGGDGGIGAKIFDAKRRVIDRLKLLAASDPTSAASASGRVGVAGEMCFLRVINDRLERGSDNSSAGEDDPGPTATGPVAASDPFLPTPSQQGIGMGVKSTAHHAPAFIRVHQSDLDDFLADMRQDKTLWQVDADDLLGASPSSGMRRRFGGFRGGRYFSGALDPLDTECTVCLKRGHLADACKRSGPVCILCGREGHPKTECPGRLCPLCLTEGHRPDECQRYGPLLRCPCDRCGSYGHWRDQCPDIWRQYHSTVSPGCPSRPVPQSSNPAVAADAAAGDPGVAQSESESEADSESPASGPADWRQFAGKVSHSAYCCNCAQPGHSVHECIQPKSSLNRCLGSFHSQRVSRYDSVDPFAVDAAGRARRPQAIRRAGSAAAASVRTTADADADAPTTPYSRPAPLVGESFIPLTLATGAARTAPTKRHRPLSFREELDQLRDMARRLLPDGASRSQVKKLANRLRFWRRNGYQPSTPEQEDQTAHRMEEWMLEVADTHNCMHKLNFKRRCRLLNSTGATLELLRSCRPFGEPPPDSGSKSGASGSKSGASGSKPGASGSKPGASGSKSGASGSKFAGASGSQSGASGIQTGGASFSASRCDQHQQQLVSQTRKTINKKKKKNQNKIKQPIVAVDDVAEKSRPAPATAAAGCSSWSGRLRNRPASNEAPAAPPPKRQKKGRRKERQRWDAKSSPRKTFKLKREKP